MKRFTLFLAVTFVLGCEHKCVKFLPLDFDDFNVGAGGGGGDGQGGSGGFSCGDVMVVSGCAAADAACCPQFDAMQKHCEDLGMTTPYLCLNDDLPAPCVPADIGALECTWVTGAALWCC